MRIERACYNMFLLLFKLGIYAIILPFRLALTLPYAIAGILLSFGRK